MIWVVATLAVFVVLSALLIAYLIKALKKSFSIISFYEKIYNDTLDDIEVIIEFLDQLRRRELLSTDPDFINLTKAIDYAHGVLNGYLAESGNMVKGDVGGRREEKQ